jgi:hypothetical protein
MVIESSEKVYLRIDNLVKEVSRVGLLDADEQAECTGCQCSLLDGRLLLC